MAAVAFKASTHLSRIATAATKPRAVPLIALTREHTQRITPATDVERVVQRISEALYAQCMEPCLNATSRQALYESVERSWETFVSHSNALSTLVGSFGDGIAMDVDADPSSSILERFAEKLAGEDGAGEVTFAVATYERALALVPRVAQRTASAPLSEERKAESQALCSHFDKMASVYSFGSHLLIFAGRAREHGMSSTAVAVECALEMMRVGALDAYAAAREAYDIAVETSESNVALAPVSDEEAQDAAAWAEADLQATH
jgi:hypothetical protein